MKKLLAAMFVIGIGVASAASSYHVTLYKPTTVNGTQLKAGEVKLELQGDKVVLKQGKTSVETNVTVQNGNTKFNDSTVGYSGDTPNQIQEIRLGGTSTKILFDSSSKTAAAADASR